MSQGGFRSRTSSQKKVKKTDNKSVTPRRSPQRKHSEPKDDLRMIFQDIDLPRAISFDVLYRVEVDDSFANLVLPRLLRDYRLTGRDAAFATEITYGTLRSQGVVDAVIAECSSRSLDSLSAGVLSALRLGTYQLMYTRVEPHAAVDTSVRIVEAIGQERAKGFVNGILRTVSRTTPQQWLEKLAPDTEIAALAFKHAHPEWIAQSFAQVIGKEELATALEADSKRPIVHLIARPGEISAEELALITGGIEGTYSPYAVYLESGDPGSIEPVRQGLAAVQDEGSQLIARAVVEAPLEGEDQGRWLDLCAGPGGKAALMGALAAIDGAHVDAVEISEHRAQLIAKTVRDFPVTVITGDGRNPNLELGYDRVLVDAPCSGLGALRRRPEARWRKKEADINQLSTLQFELLSSAINLVRPGGIVVYSTCSPDLRETRSVVDKALASLPVSELNAHELVPTMLNTGENLSVQMWPHRHGTDAMFFAVLKKLPV
ncbi:Ribosomal RNA small subunit methyltransferase B [Corynebacterium kutscheri]|uniref:Ribosomal RNA small subunit methyltransferase B n=1 Tax=Corynebacterium kutscheri TaxID=35755 RepID=A0A0F6R0G6_9CORY|nr:transcription antitermination factor NusB [Corynebacterium kutscheri]AKE41295.1 tRNA/rRNA cytosine-C5-methylase [Corynebacterium kutscheri]VEH08571.1 Ribosomal RNA small subunit methyltransferase B [Corynebacterium kutscheri]VEH09617.1 Ribosomal RNA small subunit methyltransferase B [Corynebacterium kutscheri]VEH79700.1 Ribosomal RNA small subunit methyltransferase B [Corynebacterium kutscheri]